MDPITIILTGLPRGKGRPRFSVRGRHAVAYTDEKTSSFEGSLRLMTSLAMDGCEPLSGPISMDMIASFPIPASWSKSKRAAAVNGTLRPTGKPDADNLLKCIDALNGIAWHDDAQVVDARVTKIYASQPQLRIVIRTLVG